MRKVIYTVEHEEPDCIRCDHVNDAQKVCDHCGRSGWSQYQRTEVVSESDAASSEQVKRLFRCCFTGHRPEKLRKTEKEVKIFLKKEIEEVIAAGIRTFISGMARGVDLWAAEIVISLREEGAPIKLIAAVPYHNFEERWSDDWKALYHEILGKADLVRYISNKYEDGCLAKRNQWMVDHSSVLLAISDNIPGGTMQTIKYAENAGITIISLTS